MKIAHITLPSSVVQDLHVGDLLRNDDTQGKIFGRIVRISRSGIWRKLQVDTDDKVEQQS